MPSGRDSPREGTRSRHPKLRKLARAAALGALTGGLGGLVMGGNIAARAAVGAGVRTGISAARESKLAKKVKR